MSPSPRSPPDSDRPERAQRNVRGSGRHKKKQQKGTKRLIIAFRCSMVPSTYAKYNKAIRVIRYHNV